MIQISTDKKKLNIDLIHEFLSRKSCWAKGRNIEIVKRSVEHSLCFGLYLNKNQIGFARMVSDYAVFVCLLDVFILPGFWGDGYAKGLMSSILAHEELQTVVRWGLGTNDARGLYAQFGFTPLQKPQNMMEIKKL